MLVGFGLQLKVFECNLSSFGFCTCILPYLVPDMKMRGGIQNNILITTQDNKRLLFFDIILGSMLVGFIVKALLSKQQ